MTTELTEQQREVAAVAARGAEMGGWTNNEALVIHRMYAKDANQAEFMAFARLCRETGLSPLNGEIFCTIYNKNNPDKRSMVVITAVAGYRKIGFATGEVVQLDGPLWLDGDGNWLDVWIDGARNPLAARFGIARTGMIEPRTVTVTWKEFAKDPNSKEGDFWKRMPAHMLAKIAESQAWRAVFPAQMNSLFDDAEVSDGMPPPDSMVDAIADAADVPELPAGSDSGPSNDVEETEPDPEPTPAAKPKAKAKAKATPKEVGTEGAIGALEVAINVAGVTRDQIDAVTGGESDGEVVAWLFTQIGDEPKTFQAVNNAIGTLVEMAREA